MRTSSTRRLLAPLIALLATACGGGGGGGGAQPVTVLAQLKAVLLGANEPTVVDAEARAIVLLEVRSNGTIAFAAAAPGSIATDVSGLHLHRGAPGINGPIEVDLLSGGATFDPATGTASGNVSAPAILATEIAATPEDFYANLHTPAAPLGLCRAQLAIAQVQEAHCVLRGTEETGQPVPDARGAATLRASPTGQVDVVVAMSPAPVPITDLTAAHVHVGGLGQDGSIVLDLDLTAATLDAAAGTRAGTILAPRVTLARLCLDPAGFYVNVHTTAQPAGVARGQLTQAGAELWACVRGDEEVPVQDAGARGGAALLLDTLDSGRVMLAVQPGVAGQTIADVIGAHVHIGATGANGGILIDLLSGADYTTNPASETSEGAISYTPAILARMLAHPAGFYVNLHTAEFPGGLLRGQLSRSPVSFFAAMTSGNEVPVPDPDPGHSGALTAVFTGIFRCAFTVEMASPPASSLVSGHVHDGAAGIEGAILIDLLGAPDAQVAGDVIAGTATFAGRTLVRLMAAPELYYGNMHDEAFPGGAVRGQLSKLDGQVPPANLRYAVAPAAYDEQSAITPNAPISSGGAIESYEVDPALPLGLSLHAQTGVISGTPTLVTANATYTVTGTNSAGQVSYPLDIEILAVAPTALNYASPVTYTQNTAIAANTPSNGGGKITSYAVSPALPDGLSLHATTGVISGTPTVTQSATDHTVTGTNDAGSTDFDVNITVTAALQAPSGLTYTTLDATYSTGTAITANSPSSSGGAVASSSVSPALPSGLSLNTTTGVITGMPTQVTSDATYTVTASNAAGDTTVGLTIEVVLGAPKNLSYSPNNQIGYQNFAINNMSPTIGGGGSVTYTISPALPSGISIHATTGVISGTPTGTSGQTTYTITATNSAGNTTATVQLQVL